MIQFNDVHKIFNGHPALNGVTLHVPEGMLCVLLGPSGCGKTTLLRTVNRLVEPSSGTVIVNGNNTATQNVVELRRHIGYAIQSVGLFPHRTVAENIATTPELLGTPRTAINSRVDELLAMMQLEPARYRDRFPAQLSGGEAQRVGVARALAADPPILLMDEPFGAVDPVNRAAIRDQFAELQRRLRKTILFVSHDIHEALVLADRIALMNNGKVEQFGTPHQLLAAPGTAFVASFFGGDRRMLLLETLRAVDALAPVVLEPTATGRAVQDTTPLREALLELLASQATGLPVQGPGGERLGYVTIASIAASLAVANDGDMAARSLG